MGTHRQGGSAARSSRPLTGGAGCRLCSRPLSPLQVIRGDVCDAAACRLAAARERGRARRDDELARRRASAGRRWHDPAAQAAPLVWIEAHATRLVRVSAPARREQAAHLARLAAGLDGVPAEAPAPGSVDKTLQAPADADPDPQTALGPALCAFCGGRCCRYGAGSHAFIGAEQLQRWRRAHPGTSAADAAAAYLERLPHRHVEGSCLHHGSAGCTLPPAMRSDICNRYACTGLRTLQDHPEQRQVVVAMDRAETLGAVALVGPDGARRMPRR